MERVLYESYDLDMGHIYLFYRTDMVIYRSFDFDNVNTPLVWEKDSHICLR